VIGVIVALPLEARCLVGRKLAPDERVELHHAAGWIQLCGIGREKALHAAQSLLDAGATALLSWGTAGGLDPALSAGTLVLPQHVIGADHSVFPVDGEWRKRLQDRVAGHVATSSGILLESLSVFTHPLQKQALAKRAGAVAVDMESAAVAQAAHQAGVPFMAVRVIVDLATTAIPSSALSAVDAYGRLQILPLVTSLLAHPAELPALITLGRAFRAAQKTLSTVAKLAGPGLGIE
jgi:adenosylhomocysteine nucleosidase